MAKESEVLEVLFITGDEDYVVYSWNDEKTYTMSEADLKYEESHGTEILWEIRDAC